MTREVKVAGGLENSTWTDRENTEADSPGAAGADSPGAATTDSPGAATTDSPGAATTDSPGAAPGAGEKVAPLRQIGEVAERAGVSLRTVRYYEEQGLLVPQTRTSGGFRLYSDDQIERLELITQMKPLGFTVEETRALLQARDVLHDSRAADGERKAATASLREFAAAAARRHEELSTALERAGELTRRLRHEAHAGADES